MSRNGAWVEPSIVAALGASDRSMTSCRALSRCGGPLQQRLAEVVRRFVPLVRNFGLDEFGQQGQRLLPAQVAGFDRNHRRDAFLGGV